MFMLCAMRLSSMMAATGGVAIARTIDHSLTPAMEGGLLTSITSVFELPLIARLLTGATTHWQVASVSSYIQIPRSSMTTWVRQWSRSQ